MRVRSRDALQIVLDLHGDNDAPHGQAFADLAEGFEQGLSHREVTRDGEAQLPHDQHAAGLREQATPQRFAGGAVQGQEPEEAPVTMAGVAVRPGDPDIGGLSIPAEKPGVTVSVRQVRSPDGDWRVRYTIDNVYPITAGANREVPDADDPTVAACTVFPAGTNQNNAVVRVGDKNDPVSMQAQGANTIYGGTGKDRLVAFGDETLFGEDGDDTLISTDTARAGRGNDMIIGRGYLFGDAGMMSSSSSSTPGATSRAAPAMTTCRAAAKDPIWGNSGDDLIRGGIGADTLCGGPGSDTIYGNRGNDIIEGCPGRDRLSGGPGRNTVHQ